MALQLSDSTALLVQKLLEGPSVFERFRAGATSSIDLISAIESTKELAAVPYLVQYLLDADGVAQERAVEAVESLVGTPTGSDLLRLDQTLRSHYYHGHLTKLPHWTNIKPAHLRNLDGLKASVCTVLGVLSFHASGYVREAAVRRLADLNTGDELRYLLIRLNDWVAAVRIAARQAVQARMRPANASFFATNIDLIERLTHWERVDHSQFLRWILEYLKTPECQSDLVALLQSPNIKTRRLIYRLLATPGNTQLAPLLQQGLKDRDPTIRLWSIREARKQLSGDDLEELLNIAVNDQAAAVRSQAAYAYVQHLDPKTAPLLKRLVMDPAASLRSIGRYYLSQLEPCDFPAFYRDQLSERTAKQIVSAVSGLSEVGSAADADVLLPFVRN